MWQVFFGLVFGIMLLFKKKKGIEREKKKRSKSMRHNIEIG